MKYTIFEVFRGRRMPAKVGNYDIVQSILEKFMDRIQKESAVKIYGAGNLQKHCAIFLIRITLT